MKVTFPKFYEVYKNKQPTRGTNVFLKIEGDLQAMRDVHHLAFPLPVFHRAWMEFLYGGRDGRSSFTERTLNTFTLDL